MKARKIKRMIQRKSKDHSKEQLYYKGIPCDSNEEIFFCMWCNELQEAGYIEYYGRGESYLLCGPMTNDYAQQLKTKSKPCSQTLMQGHSYTPDFEIVWSMSGIHRFVWRQYKDINDKFSKLFIGHLCSNPLGKEDGQLITHIEVKPGFDFNNMTRAFKINQKWMWNKFSIFVNLVHPQDLFEKTFTPKEFLITSTGKDRKTNWKIRSLKEYLAI